MLNNIDILVRFDVTSLLTVTFIQQLNTSRRDYPDQLVFNKIGSLQSYFINDASKDVNYNDTTMKLHRDQYIASLEYK